jgi:hypothetical protein
VRITNRERTRRVFMPLPIHHVAGFEYVSARGAVFRDHRNC